MPNRLANESSPYLLQHAHNPVDWYPWSDEAFERAIKENKPVLVSIGYAACHWCHVMERESFEDQEVAALMNENFINIKVDREERPDVDHIYMDALQAIEGSGGWPLNMFVTPERKPFYGGTYFPPRRAFNRASWKEVLLAVSKAFRDSRQEIEEQASQLTGHLRDSGSFSSPGKTVPGIERIQEAFRNIMKTADREWGGFGRAPKFPQTFTISFLLNYSQLENDREALAQALLSLDKMIMGGIYDQVGGGFARYATDTEWLAPHFEKMLYDNALLISTLSTAYQITKNELYSKIIHHTISFLEREMSHSEGGFFSALDADSEGEEGKFYVWDHREVETVLGQDAQVFSSFFDIKPGGNWEGRSIARILKPEQDFAREQGMDPGKLREILNSGTEKLLEYRNRRVRPMLDDKLLLGWNALMNMALSRAYSATSTPKYREMAIRNMEFMLKAFDAGGGLFHHTWKNGKATQPAFLDDYAFLIAALTELAQVSGKPEYLDRAAELVRMVEINFSDEEELLFYYTHKDQKDIPLRKKELYDGATPSGNALMATCLYHLSILLDHSAWRERSEAMAASLADVVVKYPTSFGAWLALIYEMIKGTREIVIVGNEWDIYLEKILGIHISHKLALASQKPLPGYPLLADKAETDKIQIYLCENYACRQPVNTIQDLVTLLQSK